MTLNSIGNYNWKESSERYIDLSLKNFTSTQTASTDFQSCTNTVIITAAGDKSQYPAAWATKEYSTEGTKAGDWCLPAAGIMTSIKNNIDLINSKYIQITGRTINKDTYLWTSSEYSNYYAWASNFNTDYGLGNYGHYGMHSNLEVRPVIEF